MIIMIIAAYHVFFSPFLAVHVGALYTSTTSCLSLSSTSRLSYKKEEDTREANTQRATTGYDDTRTASLSSAVGLPEGTAEQEMMSDRGKTKAPRPNSLSR